MAGHEGHGGSCRYRTSALTVLGRREFRPPCLLRWVVSVCAALLFAAAKRFSLLLLLILCGILFLFNPLFPVRVAYLDFKILEIVGVVAFAAAGLLLF